MPLTLLIYLSADNNLNDSAMQDLKSLRRGSFNSDITVIVQLDRLKLEAVKPYADKLLLSLEQMIIANHTLGNRMRDAHGVSIYFPSQKRPFKETFEMYEKLDFSKGYGNWIRLIKWYWVIPISDHTTP